MKNIFETNQEFIEFQNKNIPPINNLNIFWADLIGEGYHSFIYRGTFTNDSSNTHYAVKVTPPDDCKTKAYVQEKDVKAEAYLLKYINHPNIIKMLTYGKVTDPEGNERIAIVMPLANGTLNNFDLSTISLLNLIELFSGIYDALIYLHSIGIPHRDVKATNILYFNNNGQIDSCLGDFGLTATGRPTRLEKYLDYLEFTTTILDLIKKKLNPLLDEYELPGNLLDIMKWYETKNTVDVKQVKKDFGDFSSIVLRIYKEFNKHGEIIFTEEYTLKLFQEIKTISKNQEG